MKYFLRRSAFHERGRLPPFYEDLETPQTPKWSGIRADDSFRIILTIVPPNRSAYRYLGMAMAVSFVLAMPLEPFRNSLYGGTDWILNSCGVVLSFLNLAFLLQAILTPLLLFLLPGPGSILPGKTPSFSLRLSQAPTPVEQSAEGRHAARRAGLPVSIIAAIVLVICTLLLLDTCWLAWVSFVRAGSNFHPPLSPVQAIARIAIYLLGIAAAFYGLRVRIPLKSVSLLLLGCVCAAAIPLLWWPVMRWYAARSGWCPVLFDLSRPVDPFRIDYVSDCQHYFKWFGIFTTLWVGVIAGALRLQSARAADVAASSSELRSFRGFYWACFLSWAVVYRISTYSLLLGGHSQEWESFSVLGFFTLTISALWSLAFIRSLWKRRPRTWRGAVGAPFIAAFLIYMLTALTFFWMPTYAGALFIIPIFTLNLYGLLWALFVGTWHWRIRQQERTLLTTAGTGTSDNTPAHSSLRAFEMSAMVFAALLLVAALAALVLMFVVLHRSRPHPFPY